MPLSWSTLPVIAARQWTSAIVLLAQFIGHSNCCPGTRHATFSRLLLPKKQPLFQGAMQRKAISKLPVVHALNSFFAIILNLRAVENTSTSQSRPLAILHLFHVQTPAYSPSNPSSPPTPQQHSSHLSKPAQRTCHTPISSPLSIPYHNKAVHSLRMTPPRNQLILPVQKPDGRIRQILANFPIHIASAMPSAHLQQKDRLYIYHT